MVILLLSSYDWSQDNHFAENTVSTLCHLKCSMASLDGRWSALLNSLYNVDLKINTREVQFFPRCVSKGLCNIKRKSAKYWICKTTIKNTKSVEFLKITKYYL